MFTWVLQFLRGKRAKANVAFNERERVDPVIQMVDESFIIGEVRVVDHIVQRRTQHAWEPVCYLPRQDEVKRTEDLPPLAPFGWRYEIGNVLWTFDGATWVRGVKWQEKPTMTRTSASVAPLRTTDPHSTDNGMMMTAVMMHSVISDDQPTSHRHHDSGHNHCNSRDDSSPSSDYGSNDGGGSCD